MLEYATAMEGIRKLQQDNDINAFRNRMERLSVIVQMQRMLLPNYLSV